MLWSKRAALCAAIVSSAGVAAHADIPDDWTQVFMDTVRLDGGGPTLHSRNGAMMHVAMYDALQNITRTHQLYGDRFFARSHWSAEAAMAQAARDVMVSNYPSHQATYDAILATQLAGIANSNAKTQGINLGSTVAQGMISLRTGDGAVSAQSTPYTPGGNPGDWEPTFPDFNSSPHAPGYGDVTPFTMSSGSQFRSSRFDGMTMSEVLQSPEYTAQFNLVKDLGALNSASRTQDQTEAGFFWANDVNGTYKPPGHLYNITSEVAQQQGLTMEDRVRLMALVGVSMADAAIAAWDAKYNTDVDLWRPISGIREADTDGNPNTIADPNWESLNPFQPTFPAWVSGHATFGAAHGAAMAAFFGTDNISFDISSEDPYYAALFNGDIVPTRHFDSFSEAAIENWKSRLYIGVHWDWDGEDANAMGWALGTHAGSKYFLPVPAPGAGLLMTAGLAGLAARRRRA